MENREAPQMVYKIGRPQGYRVGIGIGGAYGVCPFCGKAYTEEDMKDSEIINFEHVYPRFAIKDAIKLVNRGDDKNSERQQRHIISAAEFQLFSLHSHPQLF